MAHNRSSSLPAARLLLLIAVAASAWQVSVTTARAEAADEPRQIAQVLTLVVDERLAEEARPPAVTLTRASAGCGAADVVRKGTPLCKGDKLTLASNVRMVLAFGDPTEGNEYTLGPGSEVTISSVECGTLCRWYARLRSAFTNRTKQVDLSNSGTVYEVIGDPDDSIQLFVYEGEVEVRPVATPTPAPTLQAPTGPVATVTPAPTPQAPTKVGGLFKAIINPDGTVRTLAKMEKFDLCAKLDFSSEFEITTHRTPSESAGNVAKFVNFPNNADRSDKFKAARCESFWEPGKPESFVTLGKVYNDWGDGPKALAALTKAAELYEARAGQQPPDDFALNKAIALRLAGQRDEAKAAVEAILANPNAPLMAGALNLRGSLDYDEALLALGENDPQSRDKAIQLLQSARDFFNRAAPSNSPQVQYAQTNLGQVLKSIGDIAQREKRYADAVKIYTRAIEQMKVSYGKGKENKENKFAGLTVADARVALANTYTARGDVRQAEQFYERAEETYRQLIKDAEDDNELFADPYCGLASLYKILGKAEDAQKNEERCVAFSTRSMVSETEVPNVVGLPISAAIHALNEAGLLSDVEGEGEIVGEQEPAAKEKAKVGEKVKLKRSRAPQGGNAQPSNAPAAAPNERAAPAEPNGQQRRSRRRGP